MEKALLSTVRFIDTTIGEGSGKIFHWLVIPMAAALTYEVIARYGFNAPTIWAYDVTYMLYGTHFMLGATYALRTGGHIRTDIFYGKWSPRTQGIIDSICYAVLFFPGMFFFFRSGLVEAILSVSLLEKSDASPWRPPIYPFKCVVPLAALLLLIQGVSEFLKSIYAAWRGRWL
jgi:TRAP-type mannitol/chloroaromatic compound transport system permease small subunit